MSKMMTLKEIETEFGPKVLTLRVLIHQGLLEAHKVGKKMMVSRDEFESFLERQKIVIVNKE